MANPLIEVGGALYRVMYPLIEVGGALYVVAYPLIEMGGALYRVAYPLIEFGRALYHVAQPLIASHKTTFVFIQKHTSYLQETVSHHHNPVNVINKVGTVNTTPTLK